MSELLWILVGNTVFIATLAGVVIWRLNVVYSTTAASADEREKTLLKMLKNTEDRIHATTLGDYLAIRDAPPVAPHPSQSRSDSAEAAIEETSRMGEGLNGGGY